MSVNDEMPSNPLGGSLAEQPLPSADAAPPAAPSIPAALSGVPLTIQVVVGTARMTLSRIAALGPGAMVALDQKLGAPVTILVNGRTVAMGDLFVTDSASGQLGIRITGLPDGAARP